MLRLILGTDWSANRKRMLHLLTEADAVNAARVLLVPEQITHDMERQLCVAVGPEAGQRMEVLSFTRLASRVLALTGGIARETLDAGGRILAMAAAVEQLRAKLKAYAAVGSRPEFLQDLVSAVDELKGACIRPESLQRAALKSNGALAQKLEELALILQTYEAVCAQGRQDPKDRIALLQERLEESRFAEQHVFYVDGFSDFTGQEIEILAGLIQNAPEVTVTLVCRNVQDKGAPFSVAAETARQLLHIANRMGVMTDVQEEPGWNERKAVGDVCQGLFGGNASGDVTDVLKLLSCSDSQEECAAAADEILTWVYGGGRYRDYSVVYTDDTIYRPLLRQTFHRCGIPFYEAGSDSIMEKPVAVMTAAVLEAVTGNMEQTAVLRYLKSPLSPLEPDDCDRMENFVLLWNITGRLWNGPWKMHPAGLGKVWTEEDTVRLEELEASRRLAVEPLLTLRRELRCAENTGKQLRALYYFFQEIHLPERMQALALRQSDEGDGRAAQETEQLWQILADAMEQMDALLGRTVRDADSFSRTFCLLLQQYDVGTIPAVLDAVVLGDISAMRRREAQNLFLMGAEEGKLPSYGSGGSILTEQERTQLINLGLPLQGGQQRRMEHEFAGIFAAVSAARRHITVSGSGEQKAFLYRRLCGMLQQTDGASRQEDGPAEFADTWQAASYLVCRGMPVPKQIKDQAAILRGRSAYRMGMLSAETVSGLYGSRPCLSASQADKLASCRFAYFMRYGMRVQERKQVSVDPAEYGTFVHDVLEHTVRTVMKEGGFSSVTLEQTQKIAMERAQVYQNERFRELWDQNMRGEFLFNRNLAELQIVVQDLWNELSQAEFIPVGCEVSFGPNAQLPPIEIYGEKMHALLRGFVDRVDCFREGDHTWVRVVDYKTGSKSLDYCDILNGIGLQMLIYLFALENGGRSLTGSRTEPAGVLYMPARAPVLSVSKRVTREEAQMLREQEQRRSGLILLNERVMQAMEPGSQPRLLPYKRMKDGAAIGDLADNTQMRLLERYVSHKLEALADRLATGDVTPDPYIRGTHSICQYCEFASACHVNDVGEKRIMKAVSAQEFWTQLEREEKERHRG